jgi:predicted glycosyltransferase
MKEPDIIYRTRESEVNRYLFNLKITDISRLDNPYVLFENKPLDEHGFLILSPAMPG